jgi:hypothetical protein
LDQEASFGRLLKYLGERGMRLKVSREMAIQALKSSIAPQKSGTFRKGKPGGWQEHFTVKNKQVFKEIAGDLLIQMGYEKDLDW